MTYKPTHKINAIDLDGNCVASFYGYDAPAPSVIFAEFADAARVVVYNRQGVTHETFWRDAT
jgi:hypothetical protein